MLFADNMSCTSVPCDCMFFNILETGKLSDSVNAYPRLLGMQFVNLVSFQTLTGIFWFAPSYIVHLPTQTLYLSQTRAIAGPQLSCHPPDFSYSCTARQVSASKMDAGYDFQQENPQKLLD